MKRKIILLLAAVFLSVPCVVCGEEGDGDSVFGFSKTDPIVTSVHGSSSNLQGTVIVTPGSWGKAPEGVSPASSSIVTSLVDPKATAASGTQIAGSGEKKESVLNGTAPSTSSIVSTVVNPQASSSGTLVSAPAQDNK